MSPDVLLISLGTTHGLRLADADLGDELRAAGASTEIVSVGLGATNALRKGYPVNDWVEAYAARRALASATRRLRPRSIVISTTTAALLTPKLGIPFAVRLDSPARLNRPGPLNAPQRALERGQLARARVLLPLSYAAVPELPAGAARPIVLPPPLRTSQASAGTRERIAVAYVPDLRAKGLDIVCEAWARAGVADASLELFGIDEPEGRRQLARRGVATPAGVRWRGRTDHATFRAALGRATVFVQGARWEDYGQAPLEALDDGALLVTVPCRGPYEALALARSLDAGLVANAIDPAALAEPIKRAFAYSTSDIERYRHEAQRSLIPYRPEAFRRTVAREVLPALLEH